MKKKQIKIIAEAGVNHNGEINNAKKMIKIASEAGADFVKFQAFQPDKLIIPSAKKTKYQINNTGNKNETQIEMLKKNMLTFEQLKLLKKFAEKRKIKFLATPFDEESFNQLKKLKLNIIKISSGDLTNLPFLEHISKNLKKTDKIIISTGMGNIIEIRDALKSLTKGNIMKKNITILHCTSNYPASDVSVHMNSLETIKRKFKTKIGYSDHTMRNIASILAIGKGAEVIEKHFTLDRKLKGPDHKASLEPHELHNFIRDMRTAYKMLGSYIKKARKEELNVKKLARKSIFAKKKIMRGEKFTINNLDIKRPEIGLKPKMFFSILNKKSKKKYLKDQKIL